MSWSGKPRGVPTCQLHMELCVGAYELDMGLDQDKLLHVEVRGSNNTDQYQRLGM